MDARIFHEAIRSATVTYPIPFVFGVLLLFAVLCLGGSMAVTEWLRVLLAALGTGSAVSAVALVGTQSHRGRRPCGRNSTCSACGWLR
jgi:hypothetical protein